MEILTTVKPQTQGILHNDARVSADTPDTDNGDNLAHTDTTVTQKADLTLTKTDSPDPVVAGTPLDYTMVVTNNGGPSTARNVTLIDDLPVEVTYKSNTISGGTGVCDKVENTVNQLKCDLNDLDPNQQITVILHTVVNSSAPDGGITNNAHATTSATDLGGAQASASTLVKTVSDLLIVKTSDADEYKPSALIKYTITVTDIGPSDARNVKVVDDLPPVKDAPYTSDSGNGICSLSGNKAVLTCNFGYIVAGTSKSINVYCRVKGNKGQLTNKATVSLPAPTVDPVSGNDVSTRIVTIKGKNP
jgi:uncharacterized repeat protein (TIGR01451 family)